MHVYNSWELDLKTINVLVLSVLLVAAIKADTISNALSKAKIDGEIRVVNYSRSADDSKNKFGDTIFSKAFGTAVGGNVGIETDPINHFKVNLRFYTTNPMVEEVIVKKNNRYSERFIEVGAFSVVILNFIKKILKKEVESKGILLEKNQLLHARPERKAKYGQDFSVEEMKQIVDVIEQEKAVYVETTKTKEAVIYTFEDKKNPDNINKIVVDIDRKVKKFGITNAVVTLSKVKKKDFEKDVSGELFKKVE